MLADEGGYSGTFDQFFKDWISNKIIFGSWIKHLKEYLAAAADPSNKILLIRYEDLKKDLRGCVLQVAAFLECPLAESEIDSFILPKVRLV
jgi:alcohol sulfotransferase